MTDKNDAKTGTSAPKATVENGGFFELSQDFSGTGTTYTGGVIGNGTFNNQVNETRSYTHATGMAMGVQKTKTAEGAKTITSLGVQVKDFTTTVGKMHVSVGKDDFIPTPLSHANFTGVVGGIEHHGVSGSGVPVILGAKLGAGVLKTELLPYAPTNALAMDLPAASTHKNFALAPTLTAGIDEGKYRPGVKLDLSGVYDVKSNAISTTALNVFKTLYKDKSGAELLVQAGVNSTKTEIFHEQSNLHSKIETTPTHGLNPTFQIGLKMPIKGRHQ